MTVAEQWDVDNAVYTNGYIETEVVGERITHEGHVRTYHGFVEVYARIWADGTKSTQLSFIRDGREHTRTIRDFYRPRYLITLAKRFADDVAQKTEPTP